jgi:3D (Asp-Asp-Asp) domain-containing protein
MTRHQSIQLARLWTALADVKARIDNEIVPLGTHLGIEDPDLMIALETLSERINTHFDRHTLQASPIKA